MKRIIKRAAGAILSVLTSVYVTHGDTNVPIQIGPRTILTNPTPVFFRNAFFMPPAFSAASVPQSPAPVTNFLALSGGWETVPDTHGAVGRDHVMTMLNEAFSVQTRTGTTLQSNSVASFWNSTNIGGFNSDSITDPRVIYDPFNDRWIATVAVDTRTTNAAVLIGVSLTSNPTNGWNLRQVKADANSIYWADYPSVAFNKDWIVVQANMWGVTNIAFERSHIWVFNKTSLYAGSFSSPTFFVHTNTQTAGDEVPAITYDNSLSTMYLLQNANGNANGTGVLRLFSITGAIGAEALNNVTNALFIGVTNTWAHAAPGGPLAWTCCFAPQSNTTERIGTVPYARLNGVVYRNGSLWASQTIFLPTTNVTRSAVQWWQIKPATAEVQQFGRIDDPSGVNFYAFSSIAVNRFNDVLIGYSSFSSNQYASASYSFRAFYDEKNKFRPPHTYWFGEDHFRNHRWGDYSATVVDPVNDTDLWTIQEYAKPIVDQDPKWGTRWAQVVLPVPANDHFTNAQTLTGAQGATNGTNYRATKETGETNHVGIAGDASIWYTWTAPHSGQATFNTVGSYFNTLLAVYTGASLTNLTPVAGDDDSAGGGASRVVFTATSNTAYRIVVDGYGGTMGETAALNWSQSFVPMILVQPEGTNVVADFNEDATFSVLAIALTTPLSYQWRHQGTNTSATTTNIPNATNASYTITNVKTNHVGHYSLVVTNTSGSVTSAVATLFVHGDSAARLKSMEYSTNQFRMHIYGLTNRAYAVQSSTNLVNWQTVFTNYVSFWYTNLSASNEPMRFYRAVTNN